MPASPSHRITPAQVLALVIIWSAVAYGLTAGDGPQQIAQADTARLVACR
jgi:ABC-type transporter Mla maintaining outer membrane lipid asymmetry permease subunit MlaE